MTAGPILFFDGVCNLCNAAVQFVIRHDAGGKIRFAALQSPAGEAARRAIQQQLGRIPDSLIFLVDGHYFTESDAALRVARHLDGGWRHLWQLRIFPRFLRNAVYRMVARMRYRLFGRKPSCMIPTPELRQRFMDA